MSHTCERSWTNARRWKECEDCRGDMEEARADGEEARQEEYETREWEDGGGL